MSAKKTIVVLRATGNQGGSVANVFLSEPEWQVRAVTRNPSNTKAKALAARGAEVVAADLDEPSSLAPAFEGVTAIFAVSDFWGLYGNPENAPRAAAEGKPLKVWAANHETEQLRSVVDAEAGVATLERFVLSSPSNPTNWSKGKYPHVYHFESKAKAAEYAEEHHPELWKKTSIFQAGFFLSNFVDNFAFQPHMTPDSTAEFISALDPDVKLPFIAAEEDTGPFVRTLVAETAGKNLIAYREWASVRELSGAFARATGKGAACKKLERGQSPFPLPGGARPRAGRQLGLLQRVWLNTQVELDNIENYFKKQDWSNIIKA